LPIRRSQRALEPARARLVAGFTGRCRKIANHPMYGKILAMQTKHEVKERSAIVWDQIEPVVGSYECLLVFLAASGLKELPTIELD